MTIAISRSIDNTANYYGTNTGKPNNGNSQWYDADIGKWKAFYMALFIKKYELVTEYWFVARRVFVAGNAATYVHRF